jgi:hypothetical protein
MNSIMREKIDRKKSAEHCSYASRTGGYVLYFKTTSHTLRILPMPKKSASTSAEKIGRVLLSHLSAKYKTTQLSNFKHLLNYAFFVIFDQQLVQTFL